jgi:hypothetical protein
MRFLSGIVLCGLLLSSCSSPRYHYQSENNPKQWKGQNISAVQAKWGSADQVFHTRSGVSYYVYTTDSGKNFFSETTTNFNLAQSSPYIPAYTQSGLKCTAIFQTDKNGVIIATTHSGNNCGGEWAPNR